MRGASAAVGVCRHARHDPGVRGTALDEIRSVSATAASRYDRLLKRDERHGQPEESLRDVAVEPIHDGSTCEVALESVGGVSACFSISAGSATDIRKSTPVRAGNNDCSRSIIVAGGSSQARPRNAFPGRGELDAVNTDCKAVPAPVASLSPSDVPIRHFSDTLREETGSFLHQSSGGEWLKDQFQLSIRQVCFRRIGIRPRVVGVRRFGASGFSCSWPSIQRLPCWSSFF